MKADKPAKHFLLAFLLALLIYAVSYYGIEHRRTRNGPWQIMFTNGPEGVPLMVVNQFTLAITNVQYRFPGAIVTSTNRPSTTRIDFGQPQPVPYPVPFGRCIFMDTTFLPGTLTFDLFGHEIELLPRVLIIDHEEHRWRSGEVIALPPKK